MNIPINIVKYFYILTIVNMVTGWNFDIHFTYLTFGDLLWKLCTGWITEVHNCCLSGTTC